MLYLSCIVECKLVHYPLVHINNQ